MALLRRWPDGDHDEDVVATFRVAGGGLTIGCVSRQWDLPLEPSPLADSDGETAAIALTAGETETLAEMLAVALAKGAP